VSAGTRLLVIVAVAGLVTLPGTRAIAGPVVTTTGGQVEGIVGPSGNEWRGVPYAAPPLGSLRWRAPSAAASWSGVRDASSFAAPCIQLAFPSGIMGSEDCLYLNVFAPATATETSSLPVMVHLHPGSNFFGAPYTDASAFTARGVIVVTVAYRLGVLGFMASTELTGEGHSGEYGVLDQIAALRWVRDNIGAFGGDPANVTLFGSSAGSFDSVAIAASPLAQGLVTRVAAQGIAFWPLTGTRSSSLPEAEEFGNELTDEAECAGSSDVLACMRALPADFLVEAAGPNDVGGPPVGGPLLPDSPLNLLRQNGSVPFLIGNDREEDAIFGFPYPDPFGHDEWVHETNAVVGAHLGGRARALYAPSAYDSLLWSAITMRSDAVHGCPTRRLANALAAHGLVWRYLYTHVYEDDPFFEQLRASHVLEEPFLWHRDFFDFGHVLTADEETLAARLTDYWTNFAKTGDPNGAGHPAWPAYDTTSEPTLELDTAGGIFTKYHAAQCRLLDSLESPFPDPWEVGTGPTMVPPGFLNGHARVP
jgi:para-nitrobenzyl esterase